VGSLAGTDADESAEIGPHFRAWAEGDDTAQIPGAERIVDLVTRMHGVLNEIADAHPGEAALVISHGGAILSAVPVLAGEPRVSAGDRSLANAAYIALEADADGWRITEWDQGHYR
jgi:broad specificity phosphatase PhoE